MKKDFYFLILGFVICILFLGIVTAYTYSNPSYSLYNHAGGVGSFASYQAGSFDSSLCTQGTDFIMQISPFNCEPAVVRSDLLEEQDVTVYCQLAATQINPLIDVEAVRYITITGEYPAEIRSVGYFPSQAALGTLNYGETLDNPVLENMGYVAITIRQNANESSMPEYVEGNLTAKLKYDAENAFGVGRAEFYLPVLSDDDFSDMANQYSFWEGRGYLRALDVEDEGATIAIYSDVNSASDSGKLKVTQFSLNKGETSNEIYIPGFSSCLASLKINLNGVEEADTRARLKINSDYVEVSDGNTFLDGKCDVKSITKDGLNQKVGIHCKDDEKPVNFNLIISPGVKLNINGETKDYHAGDYLYTEQEGDRKNVYLGYIGSKRDTGDLEDLFVVLIATPEYNAGGLSDDHVASISKRMNMIYSNINEGDDALDILTTGLGKFFGAGISFGTWSVKGENFHALNFKEGEISPIDEYLGEKISLRGYSDGINNDMVSLYNESYTFEKTNPIEILGGETYSVKKEGVDTKLVLEYATNDNPKIFLKYSTIGGAVTLATFYGDSCSVQSECSEYVMDMGSINSEKGDYEEFFENSVSGRIYANSHKLIIRKINFTSDSFQKYKEYYDSAMSDYETIKESYSGESDGSSTTSETYGEKALYEAILLSEKVGQMKTVKELCQEFTESYPDSNKPLDVCKNDYILSNSEIASREVYINGKSKIISFEGIYEPSYEEYGAEIDVRGPNGQTKTYQLQKGKAVYLDGLRDINEGKSIVKVFVYDDVSTNIVYYRFSGEKWYWSLDGITWKDSSTTSGISQLNVQIVNKLKDYNEADGRTFLTGEGAEEKEITVADSSENYGNEFIQLESADEDSAVVKIYVSGGNIFSKLSNSYTLNMDDSESYGSQFIFTLSDTNIEKVARVSVNPSFNYQSSETEFSFKVGIEKRAIQLSDEQINNRVKSLNNSINELSKISKVLGDTNKILGYSCIATGGVLTVKNFIANSNGKSIARQKIMQGSGGWNEYCAQEVAKEDSIYSSIDDCFFENSPEIDEQVNEVYNAVQSQDARIKVIQDSVPSTNYLTNKVIDENAFMNQYAIQGVNSLTGIGDASGEFVVDGKTEKINITEMKDILSYNGWESGNYNTEELREIELYANLVKTTTDSDNKKKYEQKLYSLLYDTRVNAESNVAQESFKDESGLSASSSVINLGDKKTITIPITAYETFSNSNYKSYTYGVGSPIILGGDYVYAIRDETSGERYLIVYDKDGIVSKTYKISGTTLSLYGKVNDISGEIEKNPFNLVFKKNDASSYENEYKNPEVIYYEEEPYVGYPAVVPLDVRKGWYAATKPILGAGSSIASYDASGRVSSFWLCNVGENGLEEFSNSDYGDDKCGQINLGTGQPYNQFAGLSESEATKLVNNAVSAIKTAQRAYDNGVSKVRINGQNYKVGEPAVSSPAIQCTDYMSPSDCKILFNVCDPVVCPSSRCDFGGAYPVKDVVQTGIIGSIALCAPNAREGIVLPVCTTGIEAGLDSWISVQKSYRDCLQENLETGSTVGICDQIHSIYVCEFFWKQALPLAKVAIPKVLNAIAGENTRGGGEYLGLQSAWSNAKDSLDYFKQYYAAESYDAFKIRSVDEAGGEVCKNFASVVYPSGAELLDGLTTPRSPPQFTGSFEEITMTTTTNPPTSHYKVYYHIYAGTDSGAYYQVYLSGGSSSSYYQDTSVRRIVNSSYIPVGEYASESVDFTAPSGYTKLCIVVNGQEECGFKQVSTSFAVNYVNDLYLQEQSTSGVTTEEECVSGSASLYSLLNPNAENIVDNLIDPALYEKGIIRICATDSPGKGTDSKDGTEDARWRDVGYCGDSSMRCWIDTDSVKDAITSLDIEDAVLEDTAQNYLDALTESGDYISNQDYSQKISEIKSEEDSSNKITLINAIIDKVFFNNQKAELFLLRGIAYGELSITEFGKLEVVRTDVVTGDLTDIYQGSEYCTLPKTPDDILAMTDARQRVLAAAQKLDGTSALKGSVIQDYDKSGSINCFDSTLHIYFTAGVGFDCSYSDKLGKEYTFNGQSIKTDNKIFFVNENACNLVGLNEQDKLKNIKPGDMLSIVYSSTSGHNVIFINWINENDYTQARIFDWINRDSNGNKVFGYRTVDLSDGHNTVYLYWSPILEGQSGSSGETTSVTRQESQQTVYDSATECDGCIATDGDGNALCDKALCERIGAKLKVPCGFSEGDCSINSSAYVSWNSFEDVSNYIDMFSETEQSVITKAVQCSDCGVYINNLCDRAECKAISLKLENVDCEYRLLGCREI